MTVLSAQTIRAMELLQPCDDASHDSRGCSRGLSACGYDLTLDQDVKVHPVDTGSAANAMAFFLIASFAFWLGEAGVGLALLLLSVLIGAPSLYRRTFVLASAQEHFDLPCNVVGIVHDKSSLARQGLAVQNTVAEPGWRGYLTLELSNHGDLPIRLSRGDAVAQVIFHRLDEPTVLPYDGKYQGQGKGPQEAR